jgi:recombinational DNA repair protein (RecF pathway)
MTTYEQARLACLKIIGARLERFLAEEEPPHMFWEDLEELLRLIREDETIGNA